MDTLFEKVLVVAFVASGVVAVFTLGFFATIGFLLLSYSP